MGLIIRVQEPDGFRVEYITISTLLIEHTYLTSILGSYLFKCNNESARLLAFINLDLHLQGFPNPLVSSECSVENLIRDRRLESNEVKKIHRAARIRISLTFYLIIDLAPILRIDKILCASNALQYLLVPEGSAPVCQTVSARLPIHKTALASIIDHHSFEVCRLGSTWCVFIYVESIEKHLVLTGQYLHS